MTNFASFDTQPIDRKRFWQAIGVRAVGYAVVTARDEKGPAGFLALSATHLSDSPPTLMVSIGTKTAALETVRNSRHFAINYLSEGSANLVDVFSGRTDLSGADRFEPECWTSLTTGAPTLKNAVGALDCVLEESLERFGSVIAIGRLVDYSWQANSSPLISFAGGVRELR